MAKKKKRLKRKQKIRHTLFCTAVVAAIILVIYILSLAFCNKNPKDFKEEEPSIKNPQEEILPEGYDYVTMSSEDIRRGDLILVNHLYNYAFIYNEQTEFVKLSDNKFKYLHIQNYDMKLKKNVSDALYNLVSDFYDKTGVKNLNIISADRSYADQSKILENRIETDGLDEALKYVARPGYSEHNSGLAIDFAVYNEDGSWGTFYGKYDYKWIAENAYKYGFILRYLSDKTEITKTTYESWHYRYVGAPHSYYIKQNNLCYEEYIDILKQTSFENKLNIKTEKGNYDVWFTSELKFLVPTDREYQISGNNADGFIITAKN